MLNRYVGWMEAYRENHIAFVRGAAAGDPWGQEAYEETREELLRLLTDVLDRPVGH